MLKILTKPQIQILSNFLVDAAKIIFGSAVVGFFVPGISGEFAKIVFAIGIIATILFLSTAMFLVKSLNNNYQNG